MNFPLSAAYPALTLPFHLEYASGWAGWALLAAVLVGGPLVVFLGLRSLSGLGPVRKWVAIGVRLLVLLLLVLILGGLRWQRTHRNLEVIVLKDVSDSTKQVKDFPGASYAQSTDEFLKALADDPSKRPDDTIGVIAFMEDARIEALPGITLLLDARAIPRKPKGTNVADAINLALATMSKDKMHRLVLQWDGNSTTGDLEAAIAAAVAAKVPIDVVPLSYNVDKEVVVERFIAPSWKRENEPFTVDVIVRSTNPGPVKGKLQIRYNNKQWLDMDPTTAELEAARTVTLNKGPNRVSVQVPALQAAGVHQFEAIFEGEGVDTLPINNYAHAFTFVRGKGKILYVDGVGTQGDQRPGALLADALSKELAQNRNPGGGGEGGIAGLQDEEGVVTKSVDEFPRNIVDLQNYDAVVLNNVSHGSSGLNDLQDQMLASYVHDMGGGLVMVGGPDTFGAGGWEGTKVEEILPVDMEIPAQRQIGKGALVLIVHSCEMPEGNYWGEMCAIKAIETLGAKDEIAIITFGWNNGASGFEYPLSEKGDGSKVVAAAKKMQVGDMPSFDDSMTVALKGIPNVSKGLEKSDARHKHVIIISDGDPQAPAPALVQAYKNAKITVSTVTVFPHQGGGIQNNLLPPTMEQIAADLGGRPYGPINANPSQLPQIFIKEATVVRRSLIHEGDVQPQVLDGSDDVIKNIPQPLPMLRGLVLTSRKNDPKVQMPLGVKIKKDAPTDPLLAHWQTGLGRAAVFTSDAHNKWAPAWVGSPMYRPFWAQVVRSVARPPMSSDFDVQVIPQGDKAKVVVEAVNRDDAFLNFLNIAGTVVGPGIQTTGGPAGERVRLVQTGPGTYEAEFDTKDVGNYVVALNYQGKDGKGGVLLGGMSNNSSPELRDLKSNTARVLEIATRTGGRELTPWEPRSVELFSREGLAVTASPLPVWDLLLPFLLALIILDVAVRRIAWDWHATRRLLVGVSDRVRAYTAARQVEGRQTMEALQRVRKEVAETKFRTGDTAGGEPATTGAGRPATTTGARPDPRAKFEARAGGVQGDITQVVGGATEKPIPPPPKKIEPKGGPGASGGHTTSLLEAKRRAQQAIRQKEQGDA